MRDQASCGDDERGRRPSRSDAGAGVATGALAAIASNPAAFANSRVQRQRLPGRGVQGRRRCAHGEQCRRVPEARQRQRRDEGARRGSAGVQRACRQCRPRSRRSRASRRRSPPRSRAPLPMPRTSCIRPGSSNAAIAAIAGQQRGVCNARSAAQGAERGRCSFEGVCGARRASAALAAIMANARASATSPTTPTPSAMPRRRPPRMRASRAAPPRSRSSPATQARWPRWRKIRRCSRRSAANAAAFASLASNASMMSPQADLGDRQ